jgi:transcription elongation factor Elf1
MFKYKGNNVFQFRCPVCGDSERDEFKSRGYLFPYKNSLSYKCHNCGASHKFSTFLKEYFPDVYENYSLEIYTKPKREEHTKTNTETPIASTYTLSDKLIRISDLSPENPARLYIQQRKIPLKEQKQLYYTDNFQSFVSEYTEKKVSSNPRIIIPFFDRNMNIMGFQGRSLPSFFKEIRYITIKLSETFPKLYGLHRLPKNPDVVYVVEGPIDSLFLENSVAMMGSDIDHDVLCSLLNTNNVVYVYDNEPRNKQIVSKMKNAIQNGKSVVVWPREVRSKDINDLILTGLTKEKIESIIKENICYGLEGELKLKSWSKV